ncbi:Uncharacterised protein [Salmonella enterica subsp. enterica serovar Typhi]|nr:Uncharacterised protein [Salmonella enterica subsp. enterica serovar Typhi]CQV63013.1 Uncharacterised protein [Salmonella enterica subsp. enterica serovar Typhi]
MLTAVTQHLPHPLTTKKNIDTKQIRRITGHRLLVPASVGVRVRMKLNKATEVHLPDL